jgi:glycosyltransferase involved in cell wall biosynthesis
MPIKKILHIAYSGIGGQPNVAMNLAGYGNKVDANAQHSMLFCGIEPLHSNNIANCINNNIPYYSLLKKQGFDVSFFLQLLKLVFKLKPNIIIAHSNTYHFVFYIYKIFSGAKVITAEHHSIQLRNRSTYIHSKISGIVSNQVVVLNNDAQSYFINNNIIASKKIVVIPNGIAMPKAKEVNNELVKNRFHIGIVSRLTVGKDIATVIHAIKRIVEKHPAVLLSIVGNGEFLEEYQNLVASLNLNENVLFKKFVPNEQMHALYSSIDLAIISTAGEGLPTTVIEAFSYEIPVIGSNVAGVNSIIQPNENGLLFEYQNVNELADKISMLMSNTELYNTLSANAYTSFLNNYTINSTYGKYKQLF